MAAEVLLYLDFLRDRETPHDVGPFGILSTRCRGIHGRVS